MNIPIKHKAGKLPEGFKGNFQSLFDKFAELLTAYIDGDFLSGRVGGVTPTEDIGIWIKDGQIYLWDEDASAYSPLSSLPTGSIMAFAGSNAPTDYLLCDGAEYQRSEYPTLFGVIGTTFGASSVTTFKVPDLRGRTPVGAGDGVAYADASNSQGATVIGSLRSRVLGYFYGHEFARQELRGANPVTVIKNQRTLLSPVKEGNFTAVTPPSLGLHYIIRAR